MWQRLFLHPVSGILLARILPSMLLCYHSDPVAVWLRQDQDPKDGAQTLQILWRAASGRPRVERRELNSKCPSITLHGPAAKITPLSYEGCPGPSGLWRPSTSHGAHGPNQHVHFLGGWMSASASAGVHTESASRVSPPAQCCTISRRIAW